MAVEHLTFDQLAAKYCERQQSTPAELLEVLKLRVRDFSPVGFALLECHQMDSSRLGELTVLPYGGAKCSYKEIPTQPISPRGLASDMAVVIAYCLASELPDEAGPWTPPPEPQKQKRRRKA